MKKSLFICALFIAALESCQGNLRMLKAGNETAGNKILIAGTTSGFKQKIVETVLEKMARDSVFIKVIGLGDLKREDTSNFAVIILMNSIWGGKRHKTVNEFLKADPSNKKVIVFSTLGAVSGEAWLKEKRPLAVDAIASASRDDRMEMKADELVALIRKKL